MSEHKSAEKVSTGDVTREGERLIGRWISAQENLRRAKSAVTSAECDVSNTESELAKWLMPSDMKPGEKVAVWVGDSLFQVELVERKRISEKTGEERTVDLVPKVTVRTRGKRFGSFI